MAWASQKADGECTAIVRADGSTPGQKEYDSQGEGIHALVQYYRFTRDRAWLESGYPAIQRSVDYLRRLRAGNQVPGPAFKRILPPSYRWHRTPFGDPAEAQLAVVQVRVRTLGWNARTEFPMPVMAHELRLGLEPGLADRRGALRGIRRLVRERV